MQTKRQFSYFVELEPTEDHGKGNLSLKRKDQIDKIHHQMSNITTKITHRIDSI